MLLIGFVATNITVNVAIPTQPVVVPLKSVFGWIIIHQHLGYTFDWQLPWADYKAGIGSIGGDFWLGLEKVHLLTSSQPYRLRAEVQQWSTNLWFSAEYWSFQIGDKYWSRSVTSTGHSRSVTSSTTNIDWKCLDTVETPATHSSMQTKPVVMVDLAPTSTTGCNSRHTIRITIIGMSTVLQIAVAVGGITLVTGLV